jgi:Ca-activated chloride channel family protein
MKGRWLSMFCPRRGRLHPPPLPPDPRSTVATLKEAVLATRENCRISTFALIADYWGMDWVGFVDQPTKLTKGVAFYTSSDQLANCIMESYLSGKKAYIA